MKSFNEIYFHRPFRITLCALLLALAIPVTAVAQNWTDRSPANHVLQLMLNPSDATHWIAQTSQFPLGFQETTDAGNSWQAMPLPADAVAPATIAFGPTGVLYFTMGRDAAPVSGEFYAFTRGPSSWVPFGPPTTASIKQWASHLVVGVANPDLMAFIMVEFGDLTFGLHTKLYFSDDAGQSWSAPSPWLGEPNSLEILETNMGPRVIRSDAFYPSTGTEVYYFISNDWGSPRIPLNRSDPELMASLATSRLDPATMLFSTYSTQEFPWSQLPMRRSTDGGATWSEEGVSGHYSNLMRGVMDGNLAVRHAGYTPQEGIQVSRDNGLT